MTHPYIGIDIAKARLDVALWPEKRTWQIPHTSEALALLTKELTPLAPAAIVVEASGGYEQDVIATLAAADLPVVVVNPRQVRDFAKATGQLAKTDRLDALVLAHFAEAVRPTIRPLPDAATKELNSLLVRRNQIVRMLVAETNRLETAAPVVQAHIRAHIAWLAGQKDDLDRQLHDRVRESPVWREKEELLSSVKGVGPVTSISLLAGLPELGTLSPKEAAALVGLAPLARDSGTLRGKRTIWSGRADVRGALYMAALSAKTHNPAIRDFYLRLRANGKPPKVALTACMRKLLLICNA
ncbi:MAG: IS110 family transposase, partial [Bryobacteraceae bacterium]